VGACSYSHLVAYHLLLADVWKATLRRESNDFLLPATITFLNDQDWQLRAGFFQHIACLAVNAGTAGLDAFLLPCLEQASAC
jgi:hypothetical protein